MCLRNWNCSFFASRFASSDRKFRPPTAVNCAVSWHRSTQGKSGAKCRGLAYDYFNLTLKRSRVCCSSSKPRGEKHKKHVRCVLTNHEHIILIVTRVAPLGAVYDIQSNKRTPFGDMSSTSKESYRIPVSIDATRISNFAPQDSSHERATPIPPFITTQLQMGTMGCARMECPLQTLIRSTSSAVSPVGCPTLNSKTRGGVVLLCDFAAFAMGAITAFKRNRTKHNDNGDATETEALRWPKGKYTQNKVCSSSRYANAADTLFMRRR